MSRLTLTRSTDLRPAPSIREERLATQETINALKRENERLIAKVSELTISKSHIEEELLSAMDKIEELNLRLMEERKQREDEAISTEREREEMRAQLETLSGTAKESDNRADQLKTRVIELDSQLRVVSQAFESMGGDLVGTLAHSEGKPECDNTDRNSYLNQEGFKENSLQNIDFDLRACKSVMKTLVERESRAFEEIASLENKVSGSNHAF